MRRKISDHPSTDDLWSLLQDQRAEIAELRAMVCRSDSPAMRTKNDTGTQVSRAGLLKAAAMGAAGVAGAGTLLQNGAGVAGATGAEGQTTFSSATTTPTVTVNNTNSGLAIKANGSIQSSKGVTAKTVTAINPSTAYSASAVTGQISSTAPGSVSAGVLGQSLATNNYGFGVYGTHNGSGAAVCGAVTGGGHGGAFTSDHFTGTGVWGEGDTGVVGAGDTFGGTFDGSTAVSGTGFVGGAFYGKDSGNQGVYASATNGADGLYAISDTGYGVNTTTDGSCGVYAISTDTNGNGVYGEADTGADPYGVWGATTSSSGYGVYSSGNFAATGTKSAIVPAADGSHRKLYCVESPECWFEDFGSAQLVNGHASVTIDSVFAGVVHTDLYHIFLTANGDSKGLYVSNRTATGFEVREQEGGKSSLTFSYRVVARRKDVVAPRLEQVTIKEPPARQAPRILKQPTPRRPMFDPNPQANAAPDPNA